jgi:hypothetical protein
VHFIDGTALDASSFGETNSATNQWQAIEYTGSYGTNGFYQKYASTGGHTSFTSSGSWTAPAGITSVDYLVVGGGGGGASGSGGGGGGAGAFRTGTLSVTPGTTYSITVGAGGAGGSNSVGANGSDSVFSSITSNGGGGGGTSSGSANGNASGGGGGNGGSAGAGGTYGNAGGAGGTSTVGGGGGGASAAGTAGVGSPYWGYGHGGAGSASSITGSSVTYSGGGGGGVGTAGAGGNGGSGGGGGGAATGQTPSNGTANTGGGGGGSNATSQSGGTGGSGIVVIKPAANFGLGLDSSGNGNNFTANNLVATDQVLDSPTNNFCTLNSVGSFRNPDSGGTLSEGNLKFLTGTGAGAYTDSYGTFSFSSGKWYFEAVIVDKSGGMYFGITDPSVIGTANSIYPMNQASTVTWDPTQSSGYIRVDASDTQYGTVCSAGDILGIAIDMDNDTLRGSINGTNYANFDISGSAVGSGVRVPFFNAFGQSSGGGADTGIQIINFGQDSSFAGQKTAQGNQDDNGKGDFYYAPPSGFLALCTDNLPGPTIADPTAHFITNIWTGNGSDNRTITTGFDPGLSWIKRRNGTNWHSLSDSVRAANPMPVLYSNDTSAEATDANALAFVSNGYTVDNNNYYNASAGTYVGWTWKAGGSAVSNSDGSITSSVSANTTAGFSIVSYTGHGATTGTVGHGLGVKPDLIITKYRSGAASWSVYNSSEGATKVIWLDDSSAVGTGITYWRDTEPTASVFSVGASGTTGGNANPYIAYCFHSVDGYSKIGTYEGNANANGPFVYTGFKPAMVIAKCVDSTSSWDIVDSVRDPDNGVTQRIYPNNSDAEETASPPVVDFLSNGFKVRTTSGNWNSGTSHTQLYIAFAESPFKTANAR